ncbi:BlaI/MecI/CopY family transcriptional regulator [Massilia sp. MS-15]|uniref:BlaI/MecI/CopY family transcriptional regulator n=1 Tax=Massilia sp. MS-15 TaxID=2878200 RepID=UPI001CD7DCA9|nr:BlaI/MecI/CopY family transcriptional regulator [Massilia sp. MS-15]MCA1247322.1 BlaI/MecI/CopY family transcriptional regulator [Massilia sp. MS-15]
MTTAHGLPMPDEQGISISDAESQVMEVLWRAPAAVVAEQVVVALYETRHWQSATVGTLLDRLHRKGAIAVQQDGRRCLYRPVLARETWLAAESDRLVQRLFGGRIAPLVAHFGRRNRLSQGDLRELRRLLEEFDGGP